MSFCDCSFRILSTIYKESHKGIISLNKSWVWIRKTTESDSAYLHLFYITLGCHISQYFTSMKCNFKQHSGPSPGLLSPENNNHPGRTKISELTCMFSLQVLNSSSQENIQGMFHSHFQLCYFWKQQNIVCVNLCTRYRRASL